MTKNEIEKIPATAEATEIKVLAEKINILIDKSNEYDRCLEKIIMILADIAFIEFKRMLGTKDDKK